MLNVTFHGVRGSAPVPRAENLRYGTHTACVVLEVPREAPVVLDLGSGLRRWSDVLAGGDGAAPLRASALLSHLHWGHVQGLADFAPLDHSGTVFEVYGPAPEDDSLGPLLADAFGPPWFRRPLVERAAILRFREVADETFAVGSAQVTVRSVPHGASVTNGYRVEGGGASVAYVSDHDPPPDLDRVDPGVLELADHVDLLIHDAQLSAADWPGRAGRGHSTVGYALRVAREAAARRLVLFHHDPDRDDDELDRILEVARRSAIRLGVEEVLSAYEGLTVSLEGV